MRQSLAEVKKNSHDPYELGLAAFAEKNFRETSRFFNASAENKVKELTEGKQQKSELTEEIVRDYRLEGTSHAHNDMPSKASQVYRYAVQYISKEQTPRLWAATWRDIGVTHWRHSLQFEGPAVQEDLHMAQQAYQQALEVYTRDNCPQEWAETWSLLGLVHSALGFNQGGKAGARELRKAVAMCQQAFKVISRQEQPEQWAKTQNFLGMARYRQAAVMGGSEEESAQLLRQAEQAHKRALEVHTREHSRGQWALTQFLLGNARLGRAHMTGGPDKALLLENALAAYQQALSELPREGQSVFWEQVQACLGYALAKQTLEKITQGEASHHTLEEVLALSQQVRVSTRDHWPQLWAQTQLLLGQIFMVIGGWCSGEEGQRGLAEAENAFRKALEVYTHKDHPMGWAMGQIMLGSVLAVQGSHGDGARGTHVLTEAQARLQQVLGSLDREHMPDLWGQAQAVLGGVHFEQGIRQAGEAGADLLTQAVEGYRQVLQVHTPGHSLWSWAHTQAGLGEALVEQGIRQGGDTGKGLLAEAERGYRQALKDLPRDLQPRTWAILQQGLGNVLVEQGRQSHGPEASVLLKSSLKNACEILILLNTLV